MNSNALSQSHHQPHPASSGSALNAAYQYNYTYLESIAMVDHLPLGENFSQPWLVLTGKQAIKLAINTLIANQGDRGQQGIDNDVREFLGQTLLQTLQQEGTSFKPRLIAALMKLLPQLLTAHKPATRTPIVQTEVKVSRTVETTLQPLPTDGSNPATRGAIGITQTETTEKTISQTAQPAAELIQPASTSIPPAQPVLDLSPAVSEAEVLNSIKIALQRLLESEPLESEPLESEPLESALPIEEAMARAARTATALQPPLAGVPSPAANSEFTRGIAQALHQPLSGMPAKEADVEKFVVSDLVKVLGEGFLKTFAQNILNRLKEKAVSGRPDRLEDYRKLFPYLDVPAVADEFLKDDFFAYMRVAGPNPGMLTRMTAADPRFPVTEAQYQAVMGSDSLAVAMQEGRVYLVDYAILDGAANGTVGAEPPVQKYAYAPLAMFAVPPLSAPATDRLLRPIAIQCGQSPANYSVITPASGAAWQMAKTIVQIADVNVHEAVSHFARTHLLVEPFVLATHRQIPANHPLFVLLVPHFQGTLAINNAAHQFLIAPNGGVNQLLSCTIDQSRVFMVKGFQGIGFNSDMLPRRLEAQGVADGSLLPVYPYRDDGLLVWEAIHAWVKAYLTLYYGSDAAVQSDRALQNWAQELVAFDGGRLPEFGDRGTGTIETLDYLIDAVTMVIFTGSAQHAAVNFPQAGIMSFAPAMPTAGYIPAKAIESLLHSEATSENTPEALLALLPPLDQAQSQLNLLNLLGSVYFTQLGQYEPNHFTDGRVAQLLLAFQNRLKQIEATIEQRNQSRPPYDYLRPSKIPQSINI